MTLAVDLSGKTILVCGVEKGGIGGATCRQIVKAGGAVVALDWKPALLDDIAADVRALGGTIHTLVTDLSDVGQCEAVIPTVTERFGPVDGIANVAGGTRPQDWSPLDETSNETFQQTVQLNFGYVFYLCRNAAQAWIRDGRSGAIVNVSSVSAKDAAPWHGPYGASKSAILSLTRTMANEWGQFGIRANAVSPGAVMTTRVLRQGEGLSAAARASQAPNPHIVITEAVELANAITFLMSDLASGISGQNLTVDRALSTRFCAGDRVRANTARASA